MKALWLASWYPSKNDLLTGDFFQRHARAAALHVDVHVLHIKRDNSIQGTIDRTYSQQNERLYETIVLYKPPLYKVWGISTLFSAIIWFKLMKKEINQWMLQNGRPDIIHVKAAWKAGLMARRCKTKYGIPYFVSEQYTGYFKEAGGLVPTFNFVQHYFLRKIFQGADKVLPVSDYLGKALKERYGVDYTVLDNVINTSIFRPIDESYCNTIFTLLHVSLLNLQKNPDILFQAIRLLVEQSFSFRLHLVAPKDMAETYLHKYPETRPFIILLPETGQEELVKPMQEADLLLFPSAFESFGLVAFEAIACGTPVLLSRIEVFTNKLSGKEYVSFCQPNNAESLAASIIDMHKKGLKFNKNGMHQFVDASFSEQAIGRRFLELYRAD